MKLSRLIQQAGLIVCLTVAVAACVGAPITLPPTLPIVSPTPSPVATVVPTLVVVIPTNPPAQCGPEAAIALAQTQSDLALAADGKVESLRQANADLPQIAQTGLSEFQLARDLMLAYDVPDCLLQAKVFADQFFGERINAYQSLATGDEAGYDSHLSNGEIARQNMITVVNAVLEQPGQ